MKKFLTAALAGTLMLGAAGCASDSASSSSGSSAGFDAGKPITVITREGGSGTRTAFIELFGIEEKIDGEKVDMTTEEAITNSSTSVVMTTVAGNEYAIGYISLGSLNDTVKALKIDGAAPSVDAINDGSYKIFRPFNIATKDNVSAVAQDFIDFILSADGQKVVNDEGYIKASDKGAYAGSKPSGNIVVAGSSSITPVMEKLKEAYLKINANAKIEIQQSDSSTGMENVTKGICDIGMASRELKPSETEAGAKGIVIAKDGIAVIVNKGNATDGLTSEQVKTIFKGEAEKWSEVK